MAIEKLKFNVKIQNQGQSADGILTADEFNQLPNKINELVDQSNTNAENISRQATDIPNTYQKKLAAGNNVVLTQQEDGSVKIDANNGDVNVAECVTQTARAKAYADNPPKIGDDGCWWTYDETSKAYKSTGEYAIGGIMYPSFYIDTNTMEVVLSDNNSISSNLFGIEEGYLIINTSQD